MDSAQTYTTVVLTFWCVQILLNWMIPCATGKSFMKDNGEEASFQPANFTFSIWSTIYTTGLVLWILMMTGSVAPFYYTASYFLILVTTVLNPLWILFYINERKSLALLDLFFLASALVCVFVLEFIHSDIYTVNVIGIYSTWSITALLLSVNTRFGNGFLLEFASLSALILLQVSALLTVALEYSSQDNGYKLFSVVLTALWICIGVLYKHKEDAVVKVYFASNLCVCVAFFTWFFVVFF